MITSKDGKRRITAEEFDEMFDGGEDLSDFLDMEHAELVEPEPGTVFIATLTRKINIDLPADVVDQIDEQAARCGQPRQSLLRAWIWDRLREEQERDLRLGVPPLAERSSVVVSEPEGQRAGKARGKAKGKAGQRAKSKGRDAS